MNCIPCMKGALYKVCLLIYVFPFMQCMSQFSRNVIHFNVIRYWRNSPVYLHCKTQIHSMNFHVGQEWFMWSGAILAQQFNSPGLMKRPGGNVSIPRTFQQGVCVCRVFAPHECFLVSHMTMITPINFSWTILLRQHTLIITILPCNPVIFSYLSPSHQRS